MTSLRTTASVTVLAVLSFGCRDDHSLGGGVFADGDGSDTGGATTNASVTSTSSASTGGDVPTGSSGDPDASTGDDDTSGFPGIPDVPELPPDIPETCEQAAQQQSNVGCDFYAVDLDVATASQASTWGVAIANIQPFASDVTATVEVFVQVGGESLLWDSASVSPGELQVFEPPQMGHDATQLSAGAAVHIVSDIPITAYQFNPLAAGELTSDASMLYPTNGWDYEYHVVEFGRLSTSADAGDRYPYLTVVATKDDTEVEILPATGTEPGIGIPAGAAGGSFSVTMNAGDVLQVAGANLFESLLGTIVRSDEDHEIGVFVGHICNEVPNGFASCDHTEEQALGLHQWGTRYVGARIPPRVPDTPEAAVWVVYASQDDTEIAFAAADGVTGVPDEMVTLQAREHLMLEVGGEMAEPGDFTIDANKPISVHQFMTGSSAAATLGDPASLQLAPVEQFLERYVVLVPPNWDDDYVVVTRLAGVEVRLDDAAIDEAEFFPVAGGEFEVARVRVEDGVHTLQSETAFGATVVGWDVFDSYLYLGGALTKFINEPQG